MSNTLPECLIFDWDGTIADSIPLIIETFQRTATKLQLKVPRAAAIRESIGEPPHVALQHFYPTLYTESFGLRFYSHFRTIYTNGHANHLADTLPGIRLTIAKLYVEGKTLAIASNKSKQLLETELRITRMHAFFSVVACVSDYPAKPDPAMINAIIRQTQFSPCKCLMIGDHHNDILAARAAGIRSLAVLTGSQDRHVLADYHPDFTLETAADLLSHFSS